MKTINFLILMAVFIFLSACSSTQKENEYNLIPYPQQITKLDGQFKLSPSVKVLYFGDENSRFVAQTFCELLVFSSEMSLKAEESTTKTAEKGAVKFVLSKDTDGKEGSYTVSVTKDAVVVTSSNPVGLFYGYQTIRQLLPVQVESATLVEGLEWSIPCAEIHDEPQLKYRGLMLDVGRHFFPMDFIKKYIDLLALHKMNIFHWHLTEDQGWRIEIKKYPKLAEVAAYRDETLIGHGGVKPFKYDGKKYGGFYTQDEAREIVAYAAKRFITVIPEIELPGHSQAVLTAYPELGCTGGPYEVAKRWGVFPEVYCAGEEKTFEFLENVLLEVMDIFPSEYIHIGGDECPKDRWKECAKCQKRMKQEHCHDEHELQSYFIQRAEKFLNSHGRRIIGWDEILEGGLAPNATVMSWRGEKGGIEAAKQGHDVIMTPTSHFYLDYYQNTAKEEPLAIGGFLTLSKVYSYNPYPAELNNEERKYIIGVQGNVWTEYMPNSMHVEYMVYPRACAISEVGWLLPEKKDFQHFSSRLSGHLQRLEILGVNYFNKVLTPSANISKLKILDKRQLKLYNNAPGSKLFYTVNGDEPTSSSIEYTQEIEVTEPGLIKAVAITPSGEKSNVFEVPVERLEFITSTQSKGSKSGVKTRLIKKAVSACTQIDKLKGEEMILSAIEIPEQAPAEHFALVMDGFVTVPDDAVYTFILGSDDGSQLFFNNEMLIDNDGFHAMEKVSETLALKAGSYPIGIKFFQGTGGAQLKLYVSKNGGDAKPLSNEWLSHN